MGFEIEIFEDAGLQVEFLDWLTGERAAEVQKHFNKLWEYYVNTMIDVNPNVGNRRKAQERGKCYVQAQEYGLPARITGIVHNPNGGVFGGQAVIEISGKEIVIENDIGWRINSAVDFLFGKPISFVSRSPESRKRSEIEHILSAVFAANGGIGFFQDMAVLGSVYGFVDCFVRPDMQKFENFTSFSHQNSSFEDVLETAQSIGLELIEASRALPVLDENDYKKIIYYVQHYHQRKNLVGQGGSFLHRLLGGNFDSRQMVQVTEIISSKAWQRYEDGNLIFEGDLPWGFLPVVHIQNLAQPFYYEGISDVETLIPLQDELNTRLSDRANRITFQTFKMYLGKGIDGFEDKPVSPGRMWCTDNPDATIEEFGGDSATPSEDAHIAEIREAMDKVSSVTPIVAGLIGGRVGNLTSAVALRLTLMGMLSKTDRKRFTYGEGIKKICEMILTILDRAGAYQTSSKDRVVDIIFPSPLPENTLEKLQEAQIKKELGVPAEQVLRELGYEIQKTESGIQSSGLLTENPE
jgi:hypothetical protein